MYLRQNGTRAAPNTHLLTKRTERTKNDEKIYDCTCFPHAGGPHVRALPVPYREAIHLFYYEGYSTAQIAQILDQKESTVRSRLKRGREKLKPLLEEVGALG